ncbi:MAG: hypothetical protein GWP05_03675 [Anaerolineaceae bacterium]|nr:hypothetical protein [Anaerolineaceae bacterium]
MKRFVTALYPVALAGCLALTSCSAAGEDEVTSTNEQTAPAKAEPAAKTAAAKSDAKPGTPPAETTGAEDLEYVAPGTRAAIDKAIAYLRKTQLADGGWAAVAGSDKSAMGISSVATLGLLRAGLTTADPMVAKAVNYIIGFAKKDGGIYDAGYRNYTTSISLMILRATGDKKHDQTAARALAFLKELQWDQGEGLGVESNDFGGAGYGKHKRPDLSNTQWFVQAVREAGLKPDDPTLKKALIFVSRTQATEEARFIALPDGSFIYSPHGKGESKAAQVVLPSGQKGLKGYGSMTYAGFLSLIYAGLDRNDKRVKAAMGWIRKNWTLEENPEMAKQGYYYYLMVMGKALRAYGEPVIVDSRGIKHQWRKALSAKMISLQKSDGSWANTQDRWFEDYRPLVTGYALITLKACQAKL